MGWKTIIVRGTEKIFLKNNQFAYLKDQQTIFIPFHDIDCVVLENNYTYITGQLLSKLAQHNVFLLVCDLKYDPNGIFLPFSTHWKPLGVLKLQMEIGVHFKKQIWTNLIKQKIINSSVILKRANINSEKIKYLQNLAKTITYNDATNREGTAAGVFFRSLFGSRFIRHADDGINSALNYGYKIIMSAFTRSLAKYGLNNYLGVHHHGQENPFNLSCDLMEPLRPLVDNLVVEMGENIHDKLTYNQRLELIKLLQEKVFIDNHLRTTSNAIDVMARSFLSALKQNDSTQLLIPSLAITENEYQEDV